VDDRVIWRFPRVAGLDDLFDAAGYGAGNIDGFFNSLLKA
jgi:hypothetical protein